MKYLCLDMNYLLVMCGNINIFYNLYKHLHISLDTEVNYEWLWRVIVTSTVSVKKCQCINTTAGGAKWNSALHWLILPGQWLHSLVFMDSEFRTDLSFSSYPYWNAQRWDHICLNSKNHSEPATQSHFAEYVSSGLSNLIWHLASVGNS